MQSETAACWSVALDKQAQVVESTSDLADRIGMGGRLVGRPKHGLLAITRDDDRLADVILDAARFGDTYWWSRELCGLLEGTAPAIPDFTLRLTDLITDRGFVWFDRPLPMPSRGDEAPRGLSALSWSVVDYGRGESRGTIYDRGAAEIRGAGVVFTFYVEAIGIPQPYGATSWFDGEALSGLIKDETSDLAAWVIAAARYVAAALSFLNQKIVRPVAEMASRATRRRVERVIDHGTVQVIRLRRSVVAGEHPRDAEPVEWSCRWLVRGHWRQQACGKALVERRPVFVLPHVKGPDNKPLKAQAERVFAVTR